MRWIGLLIGLLLVSSVWAGSVMTIDMTWDLPTTHTNGTPLQPGEISATNLYMQIADGPFVFFDRILYPTTTYHTFKNKHRRYCFRVTVVSVEGVESGPSNTLCFQGPVR